MTTDSLQQDVAQLQQDVNRLKLTVQRGRTETEAIGQFEARARDQAAESVRQLALLSSRIEGLSVELSRASARLEDVSQRVERLGRQGQSGSTTAPRALSPAPPPPPPAAPSQPSTSERRPQESVARAGAAPSGQASGAGLSPAESYQAAYMDFSKGHHTLAIPAFREFVRRYPDSPLADSAQYTIGESYVSLARTSANAGQADKSRQELEQAVQEFRKVLVNYPRGSKVPTALYKEALALTELRQTTLAQARLQYLLDHFPQSEEAPLAKERLAALK